jgi:predicted transcriptional regulator
MSTAREIMDEPEFVQYDAPIEEVIEKVKGAENTLIVKKDDEVVGEVHEHSLLKVLIPQKRIDEENVIGILGFGFNKQYIAETAEDLMTHHAVKARADDDVGDVAFLMDKEDLRAIPVEEDGEIIGVIHENQLIMEINQEHIDETVGSE